MLAMVGGCENSFKRKWILVRNTLLGAIFFWAVSVVFALFVLTFSLALSLCLFLSLSHTNGVVVCEDRLLLFSVFPFFSCMRENARKKITHSITKSDVKWWKNKLIYIYIYKKNTKEKSEAAEQNIDYSETEQANTEQFFCNTPVWCWQLERKRMLSPLAKVTMVYVSNTHDYTTSAHE